MIRPPDLELRTLRVFMIVAEELHFTRAAERLGIAQPPLSQQIRRLEDRIGHKLFERRKRGVELSPAGHSLLETARLLLSEASAGVEAARRAARGETGRLRVAFPASLALTSIPVMLRNYRRVYPDVHLELRQVATTQQLAEIADGSIDVGFVRGAQPTGDISSAVIMQEKFMMVLPSQHCLAQESSVLLEQASKENFVLFPPTLGHEFYAEIVQVCEQSGFHPNVAQFAEDWLTITALIRAGFGISLAPECVRRLRLDGVVYKFLSGKEERTAVSICWKSERGNSLIENLIQLFRPGSHSDKR